MIKLMLHLNFYCINKFASFPGVEIAAGHRTFPAGKKQQPVQNLSKCPAQRPSG